MALELLLQIVGASVVGSVHCAAICGPFAAIVSDAGAGKVRRLSLQLSYQGGRLLSYVALGTAAGAAGRALDLAGAAAGIDRTAAAIAGFLLLVWVSRSGQRAFMVGDGVNDAAAMSAANVGIAVHGGAEVCLAAADVFTTRAGLHNVALAADGARRTVRAIRFGIALSLVYNLIGIALAISGRLSPSWRQS